MSRRACKLPPTCKSTRRQGDKEEDRSAGDRQVDKEEDRSTTTKGPEGRVIRLAEDEEETEALNGHDYGGHPRLEKTKREAIERKNAEAFQGISGPSGFRSLDADESTSRMEAPSQYGVASKYDTDT